MAEEVSYGDGSRSSVQNIQRLQEAGSALPSSTVSPSSTSASASESASASASTATTGVGANPASSSTSAAAAAAAAASPTAAPGETDNKFMGQKERRKSSAVKMFLGDHLNLASNQSIIKLLSKNGDTSILFSDIIVKINKRHKMQDRIFLLTENAIYNIDPNGYKCKRRIILKEIGSVSLSRLPDNFFALHVPSEYDYLLVSSKKTEIVTKLLEAYEKSQSKPLPITFGNSFDYRVDQETIREIQFGLVDGGVSTRIYTKKKAKDAKK